MTETKIKVRTTLGVTDHNLLDNRFIDNQHTINAISGLEEALESKQNVLTAGENIEISEEGEISAVDTTYTAGENIEISEEGEISAVDTTYTAGENIEISEENVISAVDTTYTAGENVSIDNGVISAVDTTYTAGVGIDITNGVISNTQTSAEWGNVTGNLDDQTDLKNALDAKANSADLATVATSGSYADLSNKPTIADGILTIQKNGTTVDTFTANSSDNKTVNLVIPTTAADVSAMPDSVKYGASITVVIDSSNYQVTTTLKDQDGNTLGTAQVIDLPLESVVVSGSYDDVNKNVVLTLQNGSTITFSVADLVSGLQSEITSQNKLDADLVDDSTSTNKFVTATDKTTWNGKQDAISDLATIRAGANAGATAVQAGDLATVATTGNYADLSNTPTIPTVNNPQITITQGGVTKGSFTLNQTSGDTIALDAGGGSSSYDSTTISENASNELQAIGVKEARTDTAIRLWHGTEQQWEEGASQTWYNWIYAANGSWTSETSGVSVKLVNAAYGNNKYVVVGNNGTILSSSNGSSWTAETSGVSVQLYDVCYGDNKFIVVGNEGTILTSSDGSTWTNVSLGIQRALFAVIYADNKFIAVGGYGAIFISSNGSNWAEVTGISGQLTGIAYGNNKFIIVGDRKIYSSSDGSTWTKETPGVSEKWNGIAFGNNKFVVIGDDGTVLSSSDGSSWTEEVEADFESFKGIAFGNNTFKIVGVVSYVLTSSDGSTWTRENISTSSLKGVDLCNNKFIAVGDFGTMMSYSQTILSCFTSEAEPTTESTVYSAPNTASALTITAVGTGTITLSDTNTYNYNASGNQTTYQTIGEAYPNYICNIEGVGVKIGTTDIANKSAEYTAGSNITISNGVISATDTTYSAFGGATGSVAGSAGLVPAPTTSDVDSYLKGDGTWATLSALENTATGNNSITILGQPSDQDYSVNIGYDSIIDSTNGEGGIAIGAYGVSAERGAVAIGYAYDGVYAYQRSVVIGEDARSSKQNSVAIGYNASSDSGNDSIALGYASRVSANKEFFVGFGYDINNQRLNYKLLDGTTGKIPNDRITADVTPTQNSTNMITSGAVYTVLGDIETLLAAI